MCILFSSPLALVYANYAGAIAIAVLALQIIVVLSVLGGNGSVGHKVLWTVLVLLLPVIGLILYVLLGRNPRDRPLLE